MSDTLTYARPYLMPDGTTRTVYLPECRCDRRRGPAGGVCGCGDAIPNPPRPTRLGEHGRYCGCNGSRFFAGAACGRCGGQIATPALFARLRTAAGAGRGGADA